MPCPQDQHPKDDRADLIIPALTVPAYFAMMSVAAAKGLYQLIRSPSYWEKTFHGLADTPAHVGDKSVRTP